MKKILIITNSLSGLINFRLELIEKISCENFELIIQGPILKNDKNLETYENLGCKILDLPIDRRGTNIWREINTFKSMFLATRETQPDLILTYTIKPNIYGNVVSRLLKIPVISNITGTGSMLHDESKNRIFKNLYKFSFKKTKCVFFQNQANLLFFINNNIIKKNKSRLIPGSGVNLKKFYPNTSSSMFLNDNKVKLLFIGRVMKEKGIEELINAAEHYKKLRSDIRFLMAGIIEEDKYTELIYNHNNIEYLGVVENVSDLMNEVDAIINPSYHEGMSNVLLEGAATGKPLLASNIPGCKEIIDEGINGFLFEPGNSESLILSIEKFLDLTQHERYVMGKKSREKVEKEFDRDIVVKAYMQEIKNILEVK